MVSLPPFMRARCSTSERLQKLKQNVGSPECEATISRALEWFKTKQNKADSPFYGENVSKGIMYLLETGKKNPHGMFAEEIL
jgi:hypothetical protein